MKGVKIIGSMLFVLYFLCSCTVLQWRATDQEIRKKFGDLDIPTQIVYYQVDSLDLAIRIQQVISPDNTINMIFIHGSPSSLSAWDGYLSDTALINKTNIYAVDRPGYGYSNFGNEMPSIDKQSQIISQIINKFQLKNVIVVGSSYGGPISARAAFLNPKIKAVVMVSPAIDPKQEKEIWASRLTQWWITRWLIPTGYRVAGDEKTIHAKELAKIEKDWIAVKTPVLHIHGNADDLVPYTNVDYSKKTFQNVKIITIPDKGHEIAWKYPHLIIPHLFDSINEIDID